jgi:hypothetical protein
LGVSQRHLGTFSDRLRGQWKNIRVDVVLLEDHTDAAAFVRELAWASRPDYLDPISRIRTFFNLLAEDFSTLQRKLSSELHEDFEKHLVGLIGEEANLVLWVSDGCGHLFRFAANDRLYRSRRALRKIPYRYDTGWVVSAALAFGNTTVRTPDGHRQDPRHDPEGLRLPGTRWQHIAAVPLRVKLAGHPSLIAGALTAATACGLTRRERVQLGDVIEQKIAPRWESRLAEEVSAGGGSQV